MKSIVLKVSGILLLTCLVLCIGIIYWANSKLHNRDIPQRDVLRSDLEQMRIMTFFPHPDDEITVSGTLMKMLEKQNAKIILVCLTRGEAGPTGGLVNQSELGQKRTKEMEEVAALMGAAHLELLHYPDGGLKVLGLDSLKSIAAAMVNKFKPDIIISYDSKVGLYGHDDHRLSGLAMQEYFLEHKNTADFPVKNLFQITLSPKQIEVALQLSPGFQKKYPRGENEGLPHPHFSVNTRKYFGRILELMQAHESQKSVFQDLMPYHDKIPAFIYSRIFDREYFYEVGTSD
jgi:LmbE family N-acetylglucosaminyl deacetylase